MRVILYVSFALFYIKGGTIKLFVRLLNIQKDSKNVKYLMDEMNETVYDHYFSGIAMNRKHWWVCFCLFPQLFDHLTAGIEEICGHRGSSFFRVKIDIDF